MDLLDNWTTVEDFEQIQKDTKEFIAQTGIAFLSDFIRIKSNEWKNANIQIGIFGESGSGKSTFLNTFRGLKRGDEGFADQGYKGNTTKKATKYTIKDNPNITFTDGVGCGTIQYERGYEYLKSLEIENLDFVLLMSNKNFSQDDAWFAREIRKMGKPLFFVRTKFDEILRSAKVDGITGQNIYEEIVTVCAENIKDSGIPTTSIFIISNYDPSVGDFDKLIHAIFKTLTQNKREALLYCIPPLSHQVIKEKKVELIRRANRVAFLSAAGAAIPLPMLEILNVNMLQGEIRFYMKEFSLTEEIIKNTCNKLKIVQKELMSLLPHFQSLLMEGIREMVLKSIQSVLAEKTTEVMAKRFLKFIPFVGTILSSSITFIACLKMLHKEIDELEKEAHTLLDKVIENLKL
ncbi:interferon-gamma-inducible GTPase 10-like [Mytilus trossulus]|uniref:interferon-gamma-inducible GTPase 10-like n=1 Tax=Mytilus trossulus TaxID=6551 RepID=UPI003007BEDC